MEDNIGAAEGFIVTTEQAKHNRVIVSPVSGPAPEHPVLTEQALQDIRTLLHKVDILEGKVKIFEEHFAKIKSLTKLLDGSCSAPAA